MDILLPCVDIFDNRGHIKLMNSDMCGEGRQKKNECGNGIHHHHHRDYQAMCEGEKGIIKNESIVWGDSSVLWDEL